VAKQSQQRAVLPQETLDMLILNALLYGPAHDHQIGVMWPVAEEH
jgi:PadR family transcriptional regulator, regulatory protein PadR